MGVQTPPKPVALAVHFRSGFWARKNPRSFRYGGSFFFRSLAVSYSHMAIATLSSALCRFTSVFGMGTGGSNTLWPPGKLADESSFEGRLIEFGL